MSSSLPSFKRSFSHLNSAVLIIQSYKGETPFAHYIKNYFSQHKKFGSKDRKQISELCYAYYRLGKSFPELSVEEKILKGLQLSAKELTSEWKWQIEEHQLPEQLAQGIFPYKNQLSENIDQNDFEQSHLTQPDLFLRVRPGFNKTVAEKLKTVGIPFSEEGDAIRLNNNRNIEEVISINKEAVVQDLSSQKTGQLLQTYRTQITNAKSILSIWDCCAASGGKSIMVKDLLSNVQLTVSDIRPSIISNLKKRFAEAGITNYNCSAADAATDSPNKRFDIIIADVPCSGSGTWARTPEQLYFFEESRIDEYAKRQTSILSNIIDYLKPEGHLLYITCSVFRKENEMQVDHLLKMGMRLVSQTLIKGYLKKSDTMFAALLKKSTD